MRQIWENTWTRLHNCTPQVVNLSVIDGLKEFWTATDFLTADYNLKICEQKICLHKYRTMDFYIYIFFFFETNSIIIIIIIITTIIIIFKSNFIPKYQNRN